MMKRAHARDILKRSPMYDSIEIIRDKPAVHVTTDLNEGRYAAVSCLSCHHDEAQLAMARPVRMYIAALDCRECGEQLIAFDIFTEVLQ